MDDTKQINVEQKLKELRDENQWEGVELIEELQKDLQAAIDLDARVGEEGDWRGSDCWAIPEKLSEEMDEFYTELRRKYGNG